MGPQDSLIDTNLKNIDEEIKEFLDPSKKTLLQSPNPSPASRPNAIGGNSTNILVGSNGDPARYEVWELAELIPSHDPNNGFVKNRNYPPEAQERPYHSDTGEQQKVDANSRMFIADYFLNTDPTAQNGPPVVNKNGVVLGGNSRAMTMQLVYGRNPGAAEKYRQTLADTASHYGIDAEKLRGMKEPVLVRVLDREVPAADLARKSREYNQTSTQKLQVEAEAISRAKLASPETIAIIAEGVETEDGLASFLTRKKSLRLIDRLVRDGVIRENEISSLTNKYGHLNVQGRGLVTSIVRGIAAPDYDTVAFLPAKIGDKLDSIIASVARARAAGEDWNISHTLVNALNLINEANGKGMPVAQHLTQGLLIQGDEASAAEKILALTLERATKTEIAARFEIFAKEAKRGSAGTDLSGEASGKAPALAFCKAFLEDAAAIGKKPLASFNPDSSPLHKAVAWGLEYGGKDASVKRALERAQKKLQKAKTQEEKDLLVLVQKELSAFNGRLEHWHPKAAKILGIDENAPMDLTPAKPEAGIQDEIPLADANSILPPELQENAGPKAQVEFDSDTGRAVVTFFKSADLSSAPHEIFHVFRREIEETAKKAGASRHAKQLWRELNESVGAQEGAAWTVEQEENFANMGLRYLLSGMIRLSGGRKEGKIRHVPCAHGGREMWQY